MLVIRGKNLILGKQLKSIGSYLFLKRRKDSSPTLFVDFPLIGSQKSFIFPVCVQSHDF